MTRLREISLGLRVWFRKVMPRIAVCSGALVMLWLAIHHRGFYQKYPASFVFGLVTWFSVAFTIIYYGLKGIRWTKRRLLWRVRHRLVITFLFVGLTPVILLTVLGLLAAFAVSSAAMSRLFVVQLNGMQAQAAASAGVIGKGLAQLPPATGDAAVRSWLSDRVTLLQAALPGAKVAVWRARNPAEAQSLAERENATFESGPDDEASKGVGSDTTPLAAPLPGWLHSSTEWSGLAFVPPTQTNEIFGVPSLRALAHENAGPASYVILLSVPISRALIARLQTASGFRVEPFFFGGPCAEVGGGPGGLSVRPCKPSTGGVNFTTNQEQRYDPQQIKTLERNQFGEPRNGNTPLILGATNWLTGENSDRVAFVFEWSLQEASRQLLGSSAFGRVFQTIVIAVAVIFLLLELLALLAGTWMTRAITGTVHRIYGATEKMKQGDFSHRVHVRSRDQLGELAEAFNEMSANIESLLHERVERERLQREVEIAAEVQAQLFPRGVPNLYSAEISGECRAARGVAGDYYDYIDIVPNLIAIALGDVSGKGLSASLVMSNLQATLRARVAIAGERLRIAERATAASVGAVAGGNVLAQVAAVADLDGAISEIAASINEQLCRSTDANRFATLFLALFDDETRVIRYTNAGHNAPILVREDGNVERLAVGGLIVGVFDWATYDESSTRLFKDDVLVIFSDGISEAENQEGEEYGERRLQDFVAGNVSLSASAMRAAIFEEIDNWSGGLERGDDQTLVVLRGR